MTFGADAQTIPSTVTIPTPSPAPPPYTAADAIVDLGAVRSHLAVGDDDGVVALGVNRRIAVLELLDRVQRFLAGYDPRPPFDPDEIHEHMFGEQPPLEATVVGYANYESPDGRVFAVDIARRPVDEDRARWEAAVHDRVERLAARVPDWAIPKIRPSAGIPVRHEPCGCIADARPPEALREGDDPMIFRRDDCPEHSRGPDTTR